MKPGAHAGPESVGEKLANIAQILMGATPSAMNEYRLMTVADHERVLRIVSDATKQAAALEAHRCALPASIVEALNSGDGVYRP